MPGSHGEMLEREGEAAGPVDVFVCYRQGDRDDVATWLHDHLHQRVVTAPDGSRKSLQVYLDRRHPGVADWRKSNRHALEESALLVVCSRLLVADFERQHGIDWVHAELDWWCQHRPKVPPILVETQRGDRDRIVPRRLIEKWPGVNGVLLDDLEALARDPGERERKLRQLELSILERAGGVLDARLAEKDRLIAERERRIAQLRGLTRGLQIASAAALVLAVLALAFGISQQRERQAKEDALDEVEAKERLSEGRRFLSLADSSLESDPTLSLLLSIEAAGRSPGREANEALYAALAANGVYRMLEAHENRVTAFAFTPDSKVLLTGGNDGFACAWRVEDGTLLAYVAHATEVRYVRALGSTQIAVSVAEDGSVCVWSLNDGREHARYSLPDYADLNRVVIPPDGHAMYVTLGSQGDRRGLLALDPLTGAVEEEIALPVADCRLLRDGKTLFSAELAAASAVERRPFWFEPRTGRAIEESAPLPPWPPTDTGGPHPWWAGLRLEDIPPPSLENLCIPSLECARLVSFDNQGSAFYVLNRGSSWVGTLSAISFQEGAASELLRRGCVELSPHGELLVASNGVGVFAVDLAQDVVLADFQLGPEFEVGKGRIQASISPDEQTVALSGEGWLAFWNVRTTLLARRPTGEQENLLGFAPSGDLLATVRDGRVSLWRPADAGMPRVPPSPPSFGERKYDERASARYSSREPGPYGGLEILLPSSAGIGVQDAFGRLLLVELASGTVRTELLGGQARPDSLGLSPSERFVAVWNEQSVVVYECATGARLTYRSAVEDVWYSEDGAVLGFEYENQALELFEIATAESTFVASDSQRFSVKFEGTGLFSDSSSTESSLDLVAAAIGPDDVVHQHVTCADGDHVAACVTYRESDPELGQIEEDFLALVDRAGSLVSTFPMEEGVEAVLGHAGRLVAITSDARDVIELRALAPGFPLERTLPAEVPAGQIESTLAPNGASVLADPQTNGRTCVLYGTDGMRIAELTDVGGKLHPRYDRDGDVVLTRPEVGVLSVHDARTGAMLVSLQLEREVERSAPDVWAVFSPGGTRLWTWFGALDSLWRPDRGATRAAVLWDLATGARLSTTIPTGRPFQGSFDATGARFVTALEGGELEVHRLPAWELVATLTSASGVVWEAGFLPCGELLVALFENGDLRAWRPESWELAWETSTSRKGMLVFEGSGTTLAVASKEGLWLVDGLDGRVLAKVPARLDREITGTRLAFDRSAAEIGALVPWQVPGRWALDPLARARLTRPRDFTPQELREHAIEPASPERQTDAARRAALALERAGSFPAARLEVLSAQADLGRATAHALAALEDTRASEAHEAQRWVDALFAEHLLNEDVEVAVNVDSEHSTRVKEAARQLARWRWVDPHKLADEAWRLAHGVVLGEVDVERVRRIAEDARKTPGLKDSSEVKLPLAFAYLKSGRDADELLPAPDLVRSDGVATDLRLAVLAALRWFEQGASRNAGITMNRLRAAGEDLVDARLDVERAWFGADLEPYLQTADPRATLEALPMGSDVRRRGLALLEWRALADVPRDR